MHAAIVYLAFEPIEEATFTQALEGELLPTVRAMQGFLSGHWIEPIDKRGMGFLLFETEEQARAGSAPENWVTPGPRIVHVQIARVATSA